MLFSDMRSEFIARLVGSRPYEPYVLLSMLYRQELALVEYILDKYPDDAHARTGNDKGYGRGGKRNKAGTNRHSEFILVQ